MRQIAQKGFPCKPHVIAVKLMIVLTPSAGQNCGWGLGFFVVIFPKERIV